MPPIAARRAPATRLVAAGAVACIAACADAEPEGASWPTAPVQIEFRIAEEMAAPGLVPVEVLGEGETVYLRDQAIMTNSHVTAANAFPIVEGAMLEVWLNEDGRERLVAATTENPGQRFAVLIDSVVVSAARIVEPLQTDLAIHIPMRIGPVEASRLVAAVDETW
jgi:preprotein translocase subunit SecD